jgi:rhodanese-related sulfurtransferase
MKIRLLLVTSLVSALALRVNATAAERPQMANPSIDMAGHLRVSDEAARHRQTHRVSEAEFIRMSRQPGTVVLDARSREKYDELHVKGAINLRFPDISYETLNKVLPDKKTRILIYCNNNFREVPAFPTKAITSALNLSTFVTLYDYGYREIYELAPLLDVETSKIEFEGRARAAR